MQVTLYKYSGKSIVVDKTLPSGTGNALTIDAAYGFEGNQDVDNIYINIQSASKPLWNYAYIDSFARYYFVTQVVWLSGSLWRMNLRCDVLMSFSDTIKTQSGTILYSGSGDSRRYDPRLVYNLPPVKSIINPTTLSDTGFATGDDAYIVLAARFMDPTAAPPAQATNQMNYYIFTPAAYAVFSETLAGIAAGPGSGDATVKAVTDTFCSVTLVRWLNMSGFTQVQQAQFCSPEIYNLVSAESHSIFISVLSAHSYMYQITAEEYYNKRYLAFADTALSYADRKAQRLIDIPYVGQINVDLDNMGLPSYTGYYLCAEIGYDFGGNEYVVSLGIGATSITVAAAADYQRADYTTFSNTYTANFVSETSYSAETETRAAQLLSMLGTAAAGIVSGIMTEGATVPATVASLGIGAANFALSEQKIEYQKAASLKLSGTSNGGSAYNTMKKYVVSPQPHIVKPEAALYKKICDSSTNTASFQGEYGKPDGAFRTLSALVGTGFCQMGTVTLTGFTSATEPERNEIKNLLLSGVIL